MSQSHHDNTLKDIIIDDSVSHEGSFRPKDNVRDIYGPIDGRSAIVNHLEYNKDIFSPFPFCILSRKQFEKLT